jgi:hypothetical protein
MSGPTETLIGIVQKNSTEEIRIRLAAWHGSNIIDLRVYTAFADSDGERRPTKRGLALGLHRLPELAEAVETALAEARRRGLLEKGDR